MRYVAGEGAEAEREEGGRGESSRNLSRVAEGGTLQELAELAGEEKAVDEGTVVALGSSWPCGPPDRGTASLLTYFAALPAPLPCSGAGASSLG